MARQNCRGLATVAGLVLLSALVSVPFSSPLHGQAASDSPPFIGGPPTVFDVETEAVDSAQLLDAKRYVSAHDRKYVTYGGNDTSASSLALQEVQGRKTLLQVGRLGYVGGILPAGKKPVSTTLPTSKLPTSKIPVKQSPAEIGQVESESTSLFNRRGVFLLSPLK